MPSIISSSNRAQSPDAHFDTDVSPRQGRAPSTLRRLIWGAAVVITLVVGVLSGASLPRAASAPLRHAITQHISPLGECGGTPAPC